MYTTNAQEIFFSAINAVHPRSLMPQHVYIDKDVLHICGQKINLSSIDNLIVIAAGKAAPAMAREIEKQVRHLITKGICITKYGHALPLNKFNVFEAAHPVPDKNSILAGEIVLDTVQQLSANDIVLILLSGGASSLLTDIPQGCTLEDIQQLSVLLVNSGASIEQINIVRKHVSRIKGGQLAKAAYPAKVFTLTISDVPGDDPGSIASGPTVPDISTF
ncbi:MAG: glycerate-2-kinase family protein, partial [Ferruginibacter sp.]